MSTTHRHTAEHVAVYVEQPDHDPDDRAYWFDEIDWRTGEVVARDVEAHDVKFGGDDDVYGLVVWLGQPHGMAGWSITVDLDGDGNPDDWFMPGDRDDFAEAVARAVDMLNRTARASDSSTSVPV